MLKIHLVVNISFAEFEDIRDQLILIGRLGKTTQQQE